MSDLLTRLRQRARLTEYRICGEAAEALEAALRERDEATAATMTSALRGSESSSPKRPLTARARERQGRAAHISDQPLQASHQSPEPFHRCLTLMKAEIETLRV